MNRSYFAAVTLILTIFCINKVLQAEDRQDILYTAHELVLQDESRDLRISVPGIRGLPDAEFEKAFNDKLMKKYLDIPGNIEAYISPNNEEEVPRPYWLVIEYQKRAGTPLLSFTVRVEYNTGASTYARLDTYNIKTDEGRVLALKDLFAEGYDYVTVINAILQEQIENAPEGFFPLEAKQKNWLAEASGFYLENDSLVIVFPKYSIAPGAMGVPEFKIPEEAIAEGLRSGIE